MFLFDPMWFLIMLPPFIFMIYAQAKVNSAFKKYSKMANSQRLTGAEAAERLLRANDLSNVRVEGVKSRLGDHYDPSKKVLRLSPAVANTPSVAALGIVAHEVGHAVQDKAGYAFLRFRTSLVPAANLGSTLGYIFVILGLLLVMFGTKFGMTVVWAGVFLFSLAVIFSLVTLPVEFNASNRARQMLRSTGMVSVQEYNGASAVLSAAALTYVAATLQAIAQLFYFVLLALGSRR
ncbi:MAG: zinc metallopeptidase [Chloroflexi bacterium RBG_19FT_COMBO_47_15]|nr:MAG: zinc metallopeptidase [Chloroflexi bacterium RBG_19FT_COMBO_47_15]